MPDLSGPLTTGVDALVELVNARRTISFQDAAGILKVPIATIDAWASFLEEEGLLSVTYKFTKPYLTAVTETKKEGAPTAIKVRTTERRRAVSAHAAEGEEASAAADLLEDARRALARGDIATAKAIYDQLEKEYQDLPQKIEKEREALITTLSSLQGDYLTSVSGPDRQSEEIATAVRNNLSIVQESITSGDIGKALDAFAKANEAFLKLKPEASEVRLGLTPLLSQAQQGLVEAELHKASKDWESQLKRVKELLDAFDVAVKKQELQKAFIIYEQLDAAKKALPPMFGEEKMELENQVLPAYERLINTHVELARRELQQKLALLTSLQKRIDDAIGSADHRKASDFYEMAKKVYLAIPNEFFEKKVEAQKVLLAYAKRISELELKVAEHDLGAHLARLDKEIDAALSALTIGNVRAAHDSYNAIVQEFFALPRGFLEQKTTTQRKLVALYSGLLKVSDKGIIPLSAAPSFEDELASFRKAIMKQDWDGAVAAQATLADMQYVPLEHKDEYELARLQAELLRSAAALASVTDPLQLAQAVSKLYEQYTALRNSHPDNKELFDHVKQRYMAGHEQLKRSAQAPQKVSEMTPQAVVKAPVVSAPVDQDNWKEAISIWHDAIDNGRFDVAVQAESTFESLGQMPSDLEADVEAISEQAALLREAEDISTTKDATLLRALLPRLYSHYNGALQLYPDAAALLSHVKEIYVAGVEFVDQVAQIQDAAEAPAVPAQTAPAERSSTPARQESWDEAISIWHAAVAQGKFDVAIQAEDIFDSLGEVPAKNTYEVEAIIEQASLLRDAEDVRTTQDASFLRTLLTQLYNHYNAVQRAHPEEKALLAYVKQIYVDALHKAQ